MPWYSITRTAFVTLEEDGLVLIFAKVLEDALPFPFLLHLNFEEVADTMLAIADGTEIEEDAVVVEAWLLYLL